MRLDDTGDPKAPIVARAVLQLQQEAHEIRAKCAQVPAGDSRVEYWLGEASALERVAHRLDTGGLDYLTGAICLDCQRWNYHLASCPKAAAQAVTEAQQAGRVIALVNESFENVFTQCRGRGARAGHGCRFAANHDGQCEAEGGPDAA